MTPWTSGETARALMREQPRAALATSMDGRPYVSLVLGAVDQEGAPLMLLSGLAQHTRNILTDARVSLLYDGTGGDQDPLAGARLTVMGSALQADDPAALAAYVARHPSETRYAAFSDFRLYRVIVERGHLVAGFGRIAWIDADELLGGRPDGIERPAPDRR